MLPPRYFKAAKGVITGLILGLAIYFIAFLIFISVASAQTTSMVGGGLVVSPTKHLLSAGQTAQRFILVNRGDTEVTYEIDFVPLMKHEASFEDIGGSIIYSPRVVTIPAGGRQTVRFMIMDKPAGPTPQRARIRIQAAKIKSNPSVNPVVTKSAAAVSILFGVTVPIERAAAGQ